MLDQGESFLCMIIRSYCEEAFGHYTIQQAYVGLPPPQSTLFPQYQSQFTTTKTTAHHFYHTKNNQSPETPFKTQPYSNGRYSLETTTR